MVAEVGIAGQRFPLVRGSLAMRTFALQVSRWLAMGLGLLAGLGGLGLAYSWYYKGDGEAAGMVVRLRPGAEGLAALARGMMQGDLRSETQDGPTARA